MCDHYFLSLIPKYAELKKAFQYEFDSTIRKVVTLLFSVTIPERSISTYLIPAGVADQ